MFDQLRAFFASLAADEHPRVRRQDDTRVAAAALLFQVMDADGVRDPAEREQLRAALAEAYELDGAGLDALLSAGEAAEAEAVDLYSFTSVLIRRWDEKQRAEFVGLLWRVAFADGMLHETEDHTLWRVADLLGVDGRDRMLMKSRAAQKRAEGSRAGD
ncbi:MAG: hypothetical protein DI629_07905 [Mesorhizobium amorphae]|nr:MAG: hypothetical protein DI629_07905 [Mesorhizobium amorphae]